MSNETIAIGDPVPDLTLNDDEGTPVHLPSLKGKRVVLYFYPKDSTPGCTTQACSLRDEWDAFAGNEDIVVYGVSPDNEASHAKFRAKQSLPFHLLVDDEKELAKQFGFWVEKSMYGKKYWGVERSTVIIAEDGSVGAFKRKVKPGEHTKWLRKELGI